MMKIVVDVVMQVHVVKTYICNAQNACLVLKTKRCKVYNLFIDFINNKTQRTTMFKKKSQTSLNPGDDGKIGTITDTKLYPIRKIPRPK